MNVDIDFCKINCYPVPEENAHLPQKCERWCAQTVSDEGNVREVIKKLINSQNDLFQVHIKIHIF